MSSKQITDHKEAILFQEALNLASKEFYLDAIKLLESLIEKFPNSKFAADALFDIGMCLFNMNQFDEAVQTFNQVITDYPKAKISSLNSDREFGLLSSKAHYAIVNCYLALNDAKSAKGHVEKLKRHKDSYVLDANDQKVSYFDLANKSLSLYEKETRK